MANPESERLYNPVMRLLAPLMTSMVKRNFSKRPAQLKARLAASHAVPTAQTAAE
jgi:hypothetical protein